MSARATSQSAGPLAGRWVQPHEGDAHERLWLAWPSRGYTLGDTAEDAETARRTWAAVANVAARFEPVTVVVAPGDVEVAPRYLDGEIDVRVREIDDAWIRDSGPTFVRDDAGGLGAVTWVFNGWGQQHWASWDHDSTLAPAVAEWAGAERIDSALVNEGGGIQVDGLGTVLVTETVQRDPDRNPGRSRDDIEAELARTIGATKVIWLPRGLTRDSDTFGTRGHVDIVATIPSPGRILLHDQRDEAHPDKAVTAEIRAVLAEVIDARGEPFEIVDLPAPAVLKDDEGFVDYSYVNHVLVNGGVIACSFGDPHDADAAAILRDAYPGREVVSVDARALFERGGGIHCITQQQPVRGNGVAP
jgi:agmatine deiminase